jgi:hypothetical protein
MGIEIKLKVSLLLDLMEVNEPDTQLPLLLRKEALVPVRLNVPQVCSVCGGEEKHPNTLLRIDKYSAHRAVIIMAVQVCFCSQNKQPFQSHNHRGGQASPHGHDIAT